MVTISLQLPVGTGSGHPQENRNAGLWGPGQNLHRGNIKVCQYRGHENIPATDRRYCRSAFRLRRGSKHTRETNDMDCLLVKNPDAGLDQDRAAAFMYD